MRDDLLDPWQDAAQIALRLQSPANRLIVLIGAESWCEKCRELKPHFEALAHKAKGSDLMLWLDLEEHQEFIGSYIPESLPELLIYRQQKLVTKTLLEQTDLHTLHKALQKPEAQGMLAPDPGIAQRLAQQDWAQEL